MKKHLLLWFSSLGAAYEAADRASRLEAVILELFPFSSKGHLLLEIPTDLDVTQFLLSLKSKVEKSEVFIDLPDKVLSSYLSLSNPPLGEDLLIYEEHFLGDTLRIAVEASNFGLELLDLRFMRDTTGHSYFMATGSLELCGEFVQHVDGSSGKVTQIHQPSAGLREFFPYQ